MKEIPHLKAVEAMLRERIGFGPYPSGMLAGCISRRMREKGIDDEPAYMSLLFSSCLEQEELIEEIAVPETWFFRDYEPFVHLQKYVEERLHACSPQTPLRILSVPASTGEEAYSIAITLMEAGLTPDRFCIDAIDISGRALRKAAEARYGAASFREKDFAPRLKYFNKVGSKFRVRPEVSETVRFKQGNVLKETSLGAREFHDIVFFRNLLIYLDEANRKLAIQNVGQVLKKGGLLVLGYAEPQKLFFPEHVPVDHARSHSSRKPLERPEEDHKSSPVSAASATAGGLGTGRKRPSGNIRKQAAEATKIPPALPSKKGGGIGIPCAAPLGEPSVIIERARQLADAGMHSAAEELACECLKTDATCIEAHYLLAITALARGDEENAETHLNRVVYLDPNHNDALLHLSLLMDRSGRKDQAARYKKRIARSKETSVV